MNWTAWSVGGGNHPSQDQEHQHDIDAFGKGKGKTGKGQDTRQCWVCGQKGHISRDCQIEKDQKMLAEGIIKGKAKGKGKAGAKGYGKYGGKGGVNELEWE